MVKANFRYVKCQAPGCDWEDVQFIGDVSDLSLAVDPAQRTEKTTLWTWCHDHVALRDAS